jgi:hypothetical protein
MDPVSVSFPLTITLAWSCILIPLLTAMVAAVIGNYQFHEMIGEINSCLAQDDQVPYGWLDVMGMSNKFARMERRGLLNVLRLHEKLHPESPRRRRFKQATVLFAMTLLATALMVAFIALSR